VQKNTPTPLERISRTVPFERVEEGRRRVGEEQVRLVEEDHELGARQVAGLRQRLEQLRHEPHQRGGPERRMLLQGGELDAGDDAAPVRRGAQHVRDVELRLAEELGPAAGLQPHEGAQQHADGLARQPADALELGLAGLGVEEGQQRAQVGQVEQRQGRAVGVVVDEREARLLRRVRAQHLRQQLRAEVRHGGAHRHAVAEPAEREELDGEGGGREGEPQVAHALLGGAARLARLGEARHVALDVGDQHRHARRRELLGHRLQRLGLARAGGARDEPVPVHRGQRDLHDRVAVQDAVVHAAAQIDGRTLGGVGGADRRGEVNRHSYRVNSASTMYVATSAAPSNGVASPSPVTCQTEIVVRNSAPT
jgi:hypothetical protein